MVAQVIGTAAVGASGIPSGMAARALGPAQRQELSVEVLAKTEPVTRLAAEHGVSARLWRAFNFCGLPGTGWASSPAAPLR